MSDPLTTGSERLVRVLRDAHPQIVMAPKRDVDSTVKADPGIVALVAYAEQWADDTRLQRLVQEDARAALKTWETGK